MKALILAPFNDDQLTRLRVELEVYYESWLETLSLVDPDDLAKRINSEEISILVVEADFVFEETFETCQDLKFVGICRAATNHVDLDAANRGGVLVVNTPGRNARAVAELALGLILSLARRIPDANAYVKSGQWQHPVAGYTDFRGIEIARRTVGVIGMGVIGRTLAQMCLGLGMDVLGYDPYARDTPRNVKMTDLRTLASRADFISVHVPTTGETEGMLGAVFLDSMKPTAHLVNCSDIRITDQVALLDALKNHRIAGAAFDVFETQPIAPHSPLLQLDNVILTPHIGGATAETVDRHSRMMTDDILRFMNGCRPENLANPEVWQHKHG